MAKTKEAKSVIKKTGLVVLGVMAILLAIIGLSDGIFRTNVNIKNFDKELSSVSPATRRALRAEIDKVSTLNAGRVGYKANFTVREGSVKITYNEETKESYASLFVDSEKLQISLFVQLNWAGSITESKEAHVVRVECAEEANWQYGTNYCVAAHEDTEYSDVETENLFLLASYGYDREQIASVRAALLQYFKAISPNLKSALLQRDSVRFENGSIRGTVILNSDKEYQISLDSDYIVVYKSNAEIWRYAIADVDYAKHNASMVSNYLPVELTTNNGTDFVLRWEGGNKLIILPDRCKEGDNDSVLAETARNWLQSKGFVPDDFEITTQKTCSR